MMPKIIETRSFTTAEDFLRALSPLDPFWFGTGGADHWLYRGQRDPACKLVPSAMRSGAFKLHGLGRSTPMTVTDLATQLGLETESLCAFVNACIAAHLPLPEDGQWIR